MALMASNLPMLSGESRGSGAMISTLISRLVAGLSPLNRASILFPECCEPSLAWSADVGQ